MICLLSTTTRKYFFSVSGTESLLVRQKSRVTLTSTSQDNQPMSMDEISRNSKIKYLDGSGEDVTPVPLFVPPEPEEDCSECSDLLKKIKWLEEQLER